jgi:diguanylate cyclase (GGDEF)-like protein
MNGGSQNASVEKDLKRVENRDWVLWMTALTSLLLVTVAVYAVAFPLLRDDTPMSRELGIALNALVGIVLLFSLFAVYQQGQLKRLRGEKQKHLSEISELKTRAEMFEKMSILDPLTALFNMRFAQEQLPAEVARAERLGYSLTLLLLDITGFKAINEKHGHAAGDAALREFAFQIKRCIRSSDIPARLAADEFMVLLPECRSYHVPRALARLQGLTLSYVGQSIPIPFAAGWAEWASGESAEALVHRAERAMRADKTTRRSVEDAKLAQVQEVHSGKLQAIGQITGRVVHEFHNLLTVIRGYSELMLMSGSLDDANHARADEVRQAADRASQMTQQVLAFARQHGAHSSSLKLNQQVQNCEGLLQKLVGENVTLAMHLMADADEVQLGVGQVEQIVLNLVANARDAIGDAHGNIRVETRRAYMDETFARTHPGSRAGEYLTLRVTDNGCGMNDDTQSKLFKPFSSNKETRGAGLGLTSVYAIVKQWGGYVDVESNVGLGSTFTVYLPKTPLHAGEPAAMGAMLPQKAVVMVVEPDADMRNLVRECVEAGGHTAVTAATTVEALEIADLQGQRVDVAVCDLVLRGMSCREFVNALTSIRPETKLVFLAGHSDALAFDTLIAQGTLVEVPFSPADLDRAIRESLPSTTKAQRASA